MKFRQFNFKYLKTIWERPNTFRKFNCLDTTLPNTWKYNHVLGFVHCVFGYKPITVVMYNFFLCSVFLTHVQLIKVRQKMNVEMSRTQLQLRTKAFYFYTYKVLINFNPKCKRICSKITRTIWFRFGLFAKTLTVISKKFMTFHIFCSFIATKSPKRYENRVYQ